MKIKLPEPFTFEAGNRAVLLLHGFTGHSADVRMLGRYLEKKGYTTHAPIYRGHGQEPEALLHSSPDEWWEDILTAYNHLKNLGYNEIAVAGLSMGGALALKLAIKYELKGVIPMCTPMYFDNQKQLTQAFLYFARQFKKFEKKDEQTIKKEVDLLQQNSAILVNDIGIVVEKVNCIIDRVDITIVVVHASKDEIINPEIVTFIYKNIINEKIDLKWYDIYTHLMTFGDEKDILLAVIYNLLET